MKKLVFAILIGLLSLTPIGAQQKFVLTVQATAGCTQANNFLARTSGLSTTEKTAYTIMICGLVSDGIISSSATMNGPNSGLGACGSILDALYIFATNTIATAALNLCGTSYSLVTNGTVTFTADQGYFGNGTTGYLFTQFAPFTATTPNFTTNSASAGAYDLTSSTTASSTSTIIGIAATSQTYIQPLANSSQIAADVNTLTFPGVGANTNRQGAWIVTRTSNSTISLYKNGSSTPLNTITTGDTAAALTTGGSFVILAQGTSGGTAQKWSTDKIAAAFIGGALTGTQAAAINNRINAYMAAFGVNIY